MSPTTCARATFTNLDPEKQERITSVMVREFAVQGYGRASLNTIAREAGVAKGSLYQYFANKEAMFLFVFERFTELVKAAVAAAGHGRPGFWDKVEGVLAAAIDFVDAHPLYYRLYLNVLFEHEIPRREELIARVRLFPGEFFGPLVQAAAARGEVRPEVPAPMVVFMIDAVIDRFVQGYARSYLDGGLGVAAMDRAGVGREIRSLVRALQGGLAPVGDLFGTNKKNP